jgi:uncharacterized protein YjbI with pentapeptide repeats
VPSANVPGANVAGANVAGANVPGANVPGANVPSANVPGANLAGTGLPTVVRLSVTGTEGAEVLVDNVVVGNVPLQIMLPPTSAVRHITVQRSGYQRWRYDIAGDRDSALVAPLERRRKASPYQLKDPFQ